MNYVSQATAYLREHFGGPTVLDHEVYAMIAEWEKTGVPLEILETSIDELCDEQLNHEPWISQIWSVVNKNFTVWLQRTDPSDLAGS